MIEIRNLDFSYKHTPVFHNINLIVKPASPDKTENAKKAEQIGRRELAKLCVAAGKPLVKDSAELVDAVVEVKVVVGKSYNGEPDNEAKDFRKIGAGGARSAPSAGMMVPQDGGVKPIPTSGVQPIPSAPVPAGSSAKLPWMK